MSNASVSVAQFIRTIFYHLLGFAAFVFGALPVIALLLAALWSWQAGMVPQLSLENIIVISIFTLVMLLCAGCLGVRAYMKRRWGHL
ncbi:MAG TPA: hypothetical protein VJL39_03415 [Candidatus Paceibacterota bacterium]